MNAYAEYRAQMAAMPEPIPTSLGKLSDHDWHVLSSRWSRGIDWNVAKVGKRHWRILGDVGGFPLFSTKTAAFDAMSELICRESAHRAWRERQVELHYPGDPPLVLRRRRDMRPIGERRESRMLARLVR